LSTDYKVPQGRAISHNEKLECNMFPCKNPYKVQYWDHKTQLWNTYIEDGNIRHPVQMDSNEVLYSFKEYSKTIMACSDCWTRLESMAYRHRHSAKGTERYDWIKDSLNAYNSNIDIRERADHRRNIEYVHTDGLKCPHCGFTDIETSGEFIREVAEEVLLGAKKCNTCEATWTDRYILTGYKFTYLPTSTYKEYGTNNLGETENPERPMV
jgi:hypothetical protein